MRGIVSDRSWVQAMLDVEAALAQAQARLGVIPARAAQDIVPHCRADEFDVAQIGRDASDSANPVIPLVRALREKVGADAAPFVHRGATSQDILDTAMMLITRNAIDLMLEDLRSAADAAAALADRYRSAPIAGRTLMQQASVTSFGLKAAGWLIAILEARDGLLRFRKFQLAVQFGGSVGTLAALSEGATVARELATELDLGVPLLPWHTNRSRVATLGSEVAIAVGVAAKVALDLVLLAQTEVGEVHEHAAPGRGGSSALPQKQNPVDAVEILAAARGVNAQAGLLLGSMVQEHERAAGAWQAEWPAVTELLLQAGGATWRLARLLGSLDIDVERMRRNLELSDGLIMSEHLAVVIAERTDLVTARKLVEAAVARAQQTQRPFREVVEKDSAIQQHLDGKGMTRVFDPSSNLGAAEALIDRALRHHQATRSDSQQDHER